MVKINGDRILSISAIFMSFSTFLVLIYQASIHQEKNELILKGQKASAMPCLQVSLFHDPVNKQVDFTVTNKGLGPAFVQDAFVSQEQKKWNGKSEFLNCLGNKLLSHNVDSSEIAVSYTYIYRSTIISPGETVKIFGIDEGCPNCASIIRNWMHNDSSQVNYHIRYASVYGEQWQSVWPGKHHLSIAQDSIAYYEAEGF